MTVPGKQSNIGGVARQGLCMGCGTCAAACPAGAVSIEYDAARGVLVPAVDVAKCTSCGLCRRACPGIGVDFGELAGAFLGAPSPGDLLGAHKSCWFAHATDHEVRFRSSSGGLVTALLTHALERKLIDAALVTRMSAEHPLRTETVLARTREEVFAACGSKYCPSSIGPALREGLEGGGRIAVVGLPCQIQGVRKLQASQPKLRDRIAWCFGIFCCNNNTTLGTVYFLRRQGIDPGQVAGIRYRDKGWPGWITVTLKDGSTREFRRGTSELSAARRRTLSSAFHYDFMVPRCLLCVDLTAELADISFADPWNKGFLSTEKIGKSMLVARTQAGEDLLHAAADAGEVELTQMDAATVASAFKEGGAGARLLLRRLARRPVPEYRGKKLRAGPVDLVLQYQYALSYVSSRRWAWPLLGPAALVRAMLTKVLFLGLRVAGRVRRMIRG